MTEDMIKYYLSPAAVQDIEDTVTYLAQENANVAHDFLNTLYASMDLLADNPEMGHVRNDLTDKLVKFWTFKWHYLIIYKTTNPIEIVRVLSGYRDIASFI